MGGVFNCSISYSLIKLCMKCRFIVLLKKEESWWLCVESPDTNVCQEN